MSKPLLHALASRGLPFTIQGGEVVDAVLVPKLAGYVETAVDLPVRMQTERHHFTAVSNAITNAGRRMLKVLRLSSRGATNLGDATDTVWADLAVR